MKKPRKKISKMGWDVKWPDGKIEFYATKPEAVYEADSWHVVLFRCKIEEVTK